jgi:superfamily II DNA or RNA helicase
MIRLRNRYNRLFQKNIFENLNIVVLTNRIDGLEQFRDDLIHGRTWEKAKPPILSQEVLDNIRSQTFHSRADDLGNFVSQETDEVEGGGNQENKVDNFYFSTCQTANLKNLTEKLPYVDIIIIDEGHNVWGGNEFEILLKNLSTKWRDGNSPHIIAITATPSNITTELFGEPIFQFGLAEYLASPYSPRVEYRLITSTTANPDEIVSLSRRIESAKSITDIPEKKRTIREIEEQFDALMAEYPDTESLVWDILHRITTEDPSGGIWPTIVFVSSIDEADRVARTINTQTGSDITLAYHSGSKGNDALGRLANPDDSTRFVIAVDMLNESIDLPTVENIVFWRGTGMARIYLQQFGRWLRWDGVVRYYDYVGGMQNFAWIGNIYQEYQSHRVTNTHEGNTWSDTHNPLISDDTKFHITSSDINTEAHSIDLSAMWFAIKEVQESIEELSQEDVRQYFRENGTLEEWMKKTQKERTDVQIKGHKIHKIARLFWVNEDPVNIREIWYILLGKIFELRIEKFTQENVRQYFRENGTLDSWKRKSGVDRWKIYIQWYGLTKVAGIFWVTGMPINNKDIWYTLLGKIFEEEIEVKNLTQTDVKKYFRDNGTLEEWKRKTTWERWKIYIQGQGLTKVGTIFELDKNPIWRLDTWYDLLGKIFEVTIEEFTQENVRQYFRENGTLDLWKRTTRRERAKIKIKRYGIKKISTMFWINGNPLYWIDAWYSLLDAIFSEETKQ